MQRFFRITTAQLKSETVDLSATAHKVADRIAEQNPDKKTEF
jgi:hypothetical protein